MVHFMFVFGLKNNCHLMLPIQMQFLNLSLIGYVRVIALWKEIMINFMIFLDWRIFEYACRSLIIIRKLKLRCAILFDQYGKKTCARLKIQTASHYKFTRIMSSVTWLTNCNQILGPKKAHCVDLTVTYWKKMKKPW
jgi:hypothetical protein